MIRGYLIPTFVIIISEKIDITFQLKIFTFLIFTLCDQTNMGVTFGTQKTNTKHYFCKQCRASYVNQWLRAHRLSPSQAAVLTQSLHLIIVYWYIRVVPCNVSDVPISSQGQDTLCC